MKQIYSILTHVNGHLRAQSLFYVYEVRPHSIITTYKADLAARLVLTPVVAAIQHGLTVASFNTHSTSSARGINPAGQ